MVSIRRKFSAFTLSSKEDRVTLRLHPDWCELNEGNRYLTLKAQDLNLILLEEPEPHTTTKIHLGKRRPNGHKEDILTTVSFLDTNYEISFLGRRYVSIHRGYGRSFHIDGKSKMQELDTYLPLLDIALVLGVCHLSKELDYLDSGER